MPHSETSPANTPALSKVIWLTGLSGSGKSTLAEALKNFYSARNRPVCILDGDVLRRGLCSDLAFSPADRKENIRRVGEVARLFVQTGVTCIVALISPYRADRELVRKIIGTDRFVEIHVNAPIEVCERRDPKGLYARARSGQLKEFTGVSAPYEAPENPAIDLHTDRLSVDESLQKILVHLGWFAK